MLPKIILISFTLSLPILFLYYVEPHIVTQEIRSSDKPVSLSAVYSPAHGASCLELFQLDQNETKSAVALKIALPSFLPSPSTDNVKAGTEIVFDGFPYHKVSTNLLNSRKQLASSPRFDVISWKFLTKEPQNLTHAMQDRKNLTPDIFKTENTCEKTRQKK